MKAYAYATILFLSACGLLLLFLRDLRLEKNQPISYSRFENSEFGYSFTYPSSFKLNESRKELVSLTGEVGLVRVNAGCYATGAENLNKVSERVKFANRNALKVDYFSTERLVKREISFEQDTLCYLVEIIPLKPEDASILQGIISSIKF